MAKKLGADGAEETTKKTIGNVTEETFLQACADIAAENAKVQMANEARKAIRKKWKANGVELGDLDATLRMAEWDRSEVMAHFQRRMAYAKFLGLPIGAQGDMFEELPEGARLAALWHARGVTAAKAGGTSQAPAECPVECVGNYVAGYESVKGGDKAPKAKADKAPKEPKPAKASKSQLEKEAAANGGSGGIKAPPVDKDMEADFEAGGDTPDPGLPPSSAQADEELDPAFQ